MRTDKADIIARLKREILPLQGFKQQAGESAVDLGPINQAFHNKVFPVGAVHEFISGSVEDAAATSGFIAAITAQLMRNHGAMLWFSASFSVFPPALARFGVAPDRIIFIDLKKENDRLWAMEEALKCEGLSAVIGEVKDLGFTASRRFQLAVEQSRVTGFVIRHGHRPSTTACLARWRVRSISSELEEDMPGVGFPRWEVELLKLRNGKPASWQVEWAAGVFRPVATTEVFIEETQRKTG